MQETSYLVKYSLAMMEDTTKPTYFFFQTVNHRSPEGKSKVFSNKITVCYGAIDNLSKFHLTGFDSYVGQVLRVLKKEGLVELKYRFCSSGSGTKFRAAFSPMAFYNLTRINKTQFRLLESEVVHESFDPRESDSHEVSNI